MTERDLSISSQQYSRASRQSEIYGQRLRLLRRLESIYRPETWDQVLKTHQSRVKVAGSISRLESGLDELVNSTHDRSQEILELAVDLKRLTEADGEIGLEGESLESYRNKIEQYKVAKVEEEDRLSVAASFKKLRLEADQEPPAVRIFINPQHKQVVIADKLITFDEARDWSVFMYLARRRNQNVFPRDVAKVAREAGSVDDNPSAYSIRRLRKMIEVDFRDPKIIVTEGLRSKAVYRANLGEIRYFYPLQEAINNNDPTIKKNKVVEMAAFKQRNESRRRLELVRRDPEVHERIKAIIGEVNGAQQIVADKPATLFQISNAFPNVKNEFMAEMQEKYLNTEQRVGDHHPGFKRYEVVFLVYFKRFGSQLSFSRPLVNELVQMIKEQI